MQQDIAIIASQPLVKIWGEDFDEIKNIKFYKGKFVVTEDGQFFAKLYPKKEWDNINFYHDLLVRELGVDDPENMDVKEIVIGGGKIIIEFIENHIECRLYGKSTIYGDYKPTDIDLKAVGMELKEVFGLDEIPVTINPDWEE